MGLQKAYGTDSKVSDDPITNFGFCSIRLSWDRGDLPDGSPGGLSSSGAVSARPRPHGA